MELRQEVELPKMMYQLAEQHRVGQPLALYNMRSQWKRFLNLVNHFLLIIVICAVLFVLVVFSAFFYQLIEHQIVDVQWRLMMSLPGTIVGLLGCVYCMFVRYMNTHPICFSSPFATARKRRHFTSTTSLNKILQFLIEIYLFL